METRHKQTKVHTILQKLPPVQRTIPNQVPKQQILPNLQHGKRKTKTKRGTTKWERFVRRVGSIKSFYIVKTA